MRLKRGARSATTPATVLGVLLLVLVGAVSHAYFRQEGRLSQRLLAAAVTGATAADDPAAGGAGEEGSTDAAGTSGAPPADDAPPPQLSQELAHAHARDGVIVVTWANFHFVDFVLNWAATARSLGMTNYLVGALDAGTAEVLAAAGVPVFAMYAQGQNSTGLSTGDFGWGSPEFHVMGRLKIRLAKTFAGYGLDLCLCDVDTAWIKDPTPYFRALPQADILASSDALASQLAPGDAGLEPAEAALTALNIGLLYFRHSPNTTAFCTAWSDALDNDDALWDQNAFNQMVLQGLLPFQTLPENDRLVWAFNRSVVVGVLPVASFASGNAYFVQRLHEVQRVEPYIVHATFQFGGTAGKRHRMREAMLWHDAPAYYAEGSFLALDLEPPATPADFSTWTNEAIVEFHLAAMKAQLLHLRDGMALAVALNRTLIMPKVLCFADRYWGPLEKGRIPGAASTRLPFVCPMDHFLVPDKLVDNPGPEQPPVPFREHSFLENPRTPAEVKHSVLVVTPAPGAAGPEERSGSAGQPRRVEVPPQQSDAQLRQMLAPYSDVKVIRLAPVAGLLAGCAEGRDAEALMQRFRYALDLWCCHTVEPGQDGGVLFRTMFTDAW